MDFDGVVPPGVRIAILKRLAVELMPDPRLRGYRARVPDLPSYGEGETEEEAIADLKEAVGTYVEEFGLEDVTARLNAPSSLRQLDPELEDLVRA